VFTRFAAAVLAVSIALPAAAAPIPYHLFPPPPPDPIRPGFQWLFQLSGEWYLLEVTRVDGDQITYRCVNRPMPWSGVQSRATTWHEVLTYGQPRVWGPLEK